MKQSKQYRVEIVNSLISFISNHGRRFFYTNSNLREENIDSVAYMKLKNGRIYFVDNYTQDEIAVINGSRGWNSFSDGGTLRALVLDFADFIRTGKDSNGNHGYGELHCPHWGHSEEIQDEIIKYAKEIGYLV
ncbi:hypothetical protein [Sporosarcina sp. D27]|uniref:hypothetical protein n=1 Tax=Sporosarcina sp. D27 TaxID=1382305 RepID=UPI000470D281|nr:hypothetical protein [Sporosarcina sp. D27]